MHHYIARSNMDIIYDVSIPGLQAGRILKATIPRSSSALTVALCDVAATPKNEQAQR